MMCVRVGMLIAAGNRQHHTGQLSHREAVGAGGAWPSEVIFPLLCSATSVSFILRQVLYGP